MNAQRAAIPWMVCIVIALVMMTVVGGCYRSPDTTWHTPHVYKGAADPLPGKLQGQELQKQLQERFQMVQRDR